MQKLKMLGVAVCFSTLAIAQNINDIVNLNSPIRLGTPRYVGTGGAFTALGNDFTAAHLNPASLGVFRASEFGFTMGGGFNSTSSVFYGTTQMADRNTFVLANIGWVKKYLTKDPDITWNLGITFNRNNDYNQHIRAAGVNPQTSILNSWMANANNTAPQDLLGFGYIPEVLAYDAYLLDADGFDQYSTQAVIGNTSQYWEEIIKGQQNELAITFAREEDNKLYYGGSLNIPFYRYQSDFLYSEDFPMGDSIVGLDWYDTFTTKGFGFNAKFGAIYKPTQNVRLGASLFTPSIFFMKQEAYTSVTGYFANGADSTAAYVPNKFNYTMYNAPQINLGASYVFNKNGFLSLDYTFMPTKWSGSATNALSYLKDDVNSYLKNQHNVRIGGEIRAQNFFFRGGYSWLSNAYNIIDQNNSRNIYSLGLGYRTKNITFDVSFSIDQQKYAYYVYSPDLVQPANQTISRKPLLFSLSFRL